MDLARALRQKLECLQQVGVDFIPKIKPVDALLSKPSSPGEQPVIEHAESRSGPTVNSNPVDRTTAVQRPLLLDSPPSDNLTREERIKALDGLNAQVKACTRCLELVANRTQTVFGVGNPMARLCFFGEAPGADEDAQGEPFVGRAGQLLNKIIEACTLKREDVYILNVLRCRPPGNRNPTLEEATNCRPLFERQIEIINPEFIVCLGSIAASNLLNQNLAIGKLRGRFHDYRGAKVVVTYHPAYLLRNPAAKKYVWDDMKMLMREMGIPVPA
jgi:DNA polymerase